MTSIISKRSSRLKLSLLSLQLVLLIIQVTRIECVYLRSNREDVNGYAYKDTGGHVHRQQQQLQQQQQQLQLQHRDVRTTNDYYYETETLGESNIDVTLGNPMRGLVGNVENSDPVTWPEALPAALHMARLPLDSVMVGDPDVVGPNFAFNWTVVDNILNQAAKFRCHVILRFYVHWPGQPLHVPLYLLQEPYNIQTLWNGQEVVPWYGDQNLRRALEQFIDHFGQRYDGDTRLFAVQAGLLGYWGEWHTLDCTYDWKPCDPEFVHHEVVGWFEKYWKRTKIQVRYTRRVDAFDAGMGYYDDSFTYETVSGPLNGGEQHEHFFWNMSTIYGTNTSWHTAPSGGEVRPENDNVFAEYFPRGTPYHQDFMACAEISHTTYMSWSPAFRYAGTDVTATEIKNARYAHARMGYNFQLQKVSVAISGDPTKVDMDVIIKQVGIAPFYYPLFLDVYCDKIKFFSRWIGNDLLEEGDTTSIEVYGLPASPACLGAVEFVLDSYYLYPDRKMKWAQGSDGRVIVNIPMPPGVYVPENRNEVDIPKKPFELPFPPKPTDNAVGGCYIVCAAYFCYDRENGDDLRGIDHLDEFELSSTGDKISIRCEMNADKVDWVMFLWPGLHHSERDTPYAMGGQYGKTYIPVDYLSYPGLKFLEVEAWRDSQWLGTRKFQFRIT